MKRVFHLLLLTVFLTSCTNVTAPTATSTPQPTATFTNTPTLAPTITPSPTATPDPLADAPEGTTGIDKNGNFIKEIDGRIYVWTTETFTMFDGKPFELQGWFELITKDGKPAFLFKDGTIIWFSGKDMMPMWIWAGEGVKQFKKQIIISIDYPALTYEQQRGTFGNSLINFLINRIIKKRGNTPTIDVVSDFKEKFMSGNFSIPINEQCFGKPADGVPEWKSDKGYKVFILDTSTLINGTAFKSYPETEKWTWFSGTYIFYSVNAMDTDGNFVQVVATDYDNSFESFDPAHNRVMLMMSFLCAFGGSTRSDFHTSLLLKKLPGSDVPYLNIYSAP